MRIHCDVGACCFDSLHLLTSMESGLKCFDEDFISSNIKREYTIGMNMLKASRV